MYKKRTLLIVAALLLVETAAILALPSHAPRAMRWLTGGINAVAAIALILLARRRS